MKKYISIGPQTSAKDFFWLFQCHLHFKYQKKKNDPWHYYNPTTLQHDVLPLQLAGGARLSKQEFLGENTRVIESSQI